MAGNAVGISGVQKSETEAWTGLGVAFFQEVGNATRTFGAFSSLKAEDVKTKDGH